MKPSTDGLQYDPRTNTTYLSTISPEGNAVNLSGSGRQIQSVFTPTDTTPQYLQQITTTAYSGNNDYRGYLANLAKNGATQTIRNEAAALLNVVGNDGNINPSFLNQSAGANGYNATGVSNYDSTRGQVRGGTDWYGPQGVSAINQIYLSQYQQAQRQAAAAQQQAALAARVNPLIAQYNSLSTARETGLKAAQTEFDNMMKGYADQFAIDKQRYDSQVTQNEQNLTKNRQAALLQASQGGQGLRAVLAAMGALNGTGSVLADRAIAQAANKDIGEAQNTFDTNASTLTDAWADTEAEKEKREAAARLALENARNNVERTYYSNKIDVLGRLASAYGNNPQGLQYANQIGGLSDTLARIAPERAVSYADISSLYNPQNLANYLAGTKNLQVQAQSGNAQPNAPSSVVATPTQRRRDELE